MTALTGQDLLIHLQQTRAEVELMRAHILEMVEFMPIESGVTRISGTDAANQLGRFATDLLLEIRAEQDRMAHRAAVAASRAELAREQEQALGLFDTEEDSQP
jgi:hypothetical protein